MNVRFVLNFGLCSKTGKWVLSRKRKHGKPNIVLKTVKGFNKKRNLIIILILKKSLKLGIVIFVMFNTMLVIVFIINFYSGYGPGFQKPSLSICAHF